MKKYTERLLQFLNDSPTPYHAVSNLAETLDQAGFTRLLEKESWQLPESGNYYVTRNDSSLIAFRRARDPQHSGFRIVGAHTDSPCLKIKPNAITCNNGYAKLGVEVYGGALLNPWFDRDLGVAGRVTVQGPKGELQNFLINVDQPIAFIPSLAIHLDREVNEKKRINKQKHLPAVICRTDARTMAFEKSLAKWVRKQHPRAAIAKCLSFELSLYDRQPAALVGLNSEFIASARLDNLLSCFAAVDALVRTRSSGNHIVVLNDHEEVGSASTSGAEGPFLESVIRRICGDDETMRRALDRSMLVSADNAHGVHPNYAEVHEPAHQPLLNNGPVIKINNNQRYATNSETEGLFRSVCEAARVPCQTVVVRSDMACGSTIGPITATRLGVRTVDIGAPQLGMHSIRELAGEKDQPNLARALKGFFDYRAWPF